MVQLVVLCALEPGPSGSRALSRTDVRWQVVRQMLGRLRSRPDFSAERSGTPSRRAAVAGGLDHHSERRPLLVVRGWLAAKLSSAPMIRDQRLCLPIMTKHEPSISASLDIDAPAHELLNYLARPADHTAIDGSGMLSGTDDRHVLSGIGDV